MIICVGLELFWGRRSGGDGVCGGGFRAGLWGLAGGN